MPTGTQLAVFGLGFLCWAEAARAWAQAGQSSAEPSRASPHSLGASATLAVCHRQLCSIIEGGRVVCDERWLSDYRQRFSRQRSALLRREVAALTSPAALPPGAGASPQWQEVPGLRDVVSLTAGNQFICALTKPGAVWCWGHDFSTPPERGEDKAVARLFGEGSEAHVPKPAPLRGVKEAVVAIAAQVNSVYVRMADGSFLQLHDPTLSKEPPPDLAQQVRRVSRASDGFGDICYLDGRARVHCQDCRSDGCHGWIRLSGFAGPVSQLALSCGGGECPVRVAGLLRSGQLQICSRFSGPAVCPQIGDIQGRVDELVQSCGRTRTGEVYCWAMHIAASEKRAQRIPLPGPAVELAARGERVQCARLASGQIACFVPETLYGNLVYPPETIELPRTQ